MSNNNIIIARDRKNKILKFSGIEDWNEILEEFKECMSRNNHGGVMADENYEEPIEPTAALARLRGTGGVPPLATDTRERSDFVKALKVWKTSCVAVLCSLLAILTTEVSSRLEASGLNIKIATRLNIQIIIDWINVEYGGWNDARGTRNYDEMKQIPNFTSIESTNEGF